MSNMSIKQWRTDDNGNYIHDADCWYWDVEVCTCGLTHYAKSPKTEPKLAMVGDRQRPTTEVVGLCKQACVDQTKSC